RSAVRKLRPQTGMRSLNPIARILASRRRRFARFQPVSGLDRVLVHVGLTALTALAGVPGLLAANVVADPDHASVTVPAEVWRALLDENRELRTQLASQQEQIDALRQRFDAMEQATA